MIDIHCHILPGIDDGPSDLAGSLEMARAAAAAGITTAVATPHLRADFPKVRVDEVADRCAELREAIRSAGIELELVPGGEVSLSWALDATDDRLRLASYGQRGTDLLIETPSIGGPMLPQMLSQIASRGYRVVLAHPERLQDFQDDPAVVERAHRPGRGAADQRGCGQHIVETLPGREAGPAVVQQRPGVGRGIRRSPWCPMAAGDQPRGGRPGDHQTAG